MAGRFMIDELEIVHNAACRYAEGASVNYAVKLKTNEEMLAHLARPDIKDRRQDDAAIVPCERCIPLDNPEAL